MTQLPEKRRVLYILQNLPVPFDRRAWLQATTLAQHGYEVSAICPKARGFNRSRETLEGVAIYRYWVPVEGAGLAGFAVEFVYCFLATLLLSFRIAWFGRGFDIIHICNPPETYWPLAWFWRAFGKVFIWDHRDLSPELIEAKFGRRDGALVRALLWLEKMTFRAAHIVISTNESYKRIAIERGGKREDEIFIVRSGPALSRFKLYPPDLQYHKGKPHLLLYLGEICSQDGVEYLIDAVKALRDGLGRDDFHCILVGGGPHFRAVVDYAEAQGVRGLCTFTDTISDDELLCRVMSSADVAIEPVPKNGWSDRSTANKIVEYMFFGLPIVSADLTEARVSAGDAALYVAPGDARAMAEGIAALIDDPARCDRMGEFGRNRLRSTVAFEYSVPNLLAAYEAAWTRVRRPFSWLGRRYQVKPADLSN
ncbi:MAG TPA: glycosyltransferase family 4 protein [Stellaceae bacterium]|nr:glycosyltransferase family 4 protein [Stellaceae bacterium]